VQKRSSARFKQPPKVIVKRTEGGWEISVESLLPDADGLGRWASRASLLDVDGKLASDRCL